MLLVQKMSFCHKIRPVICYLTYFLRVERSSKYVSSTWQVFYWSRSVLIKRFCLVFVGRSSFVTIFCSLVNFPLWPCSVIRSPGTSVWGRFRWCLVMEHGWKSITKHLWKLHLTIIDLLLILQRRLIATKKKRMETCRLLLGLILWPEPQMIISMKSIFHTIFDTTILIMHQAPRTLPKRLSSKFFYVTCKIRFLTI